MSTEADIAGCWSYPSFKPPVGISIHIRSLNNARSPTGESCHGSGFVRKSPKRVDYLLRYTRDFPLAVVEAKAAYKHAADGFQQAKQYAEMLGLKFAYSTNGQEILEFDYTTGREQAIDGYPTPAELWARYRKDGQLSDDSIADRLLTAC